MIEFKPEVSVIMPVYNAERTIKKAIFSVLSQKICLELIIIDDCSTDGTESLIMSLIEVYQKREDQNCSIIYKKNERNSGPAVSRNVGVAMARAPWIAFLDADDWWTEGKLPAQLKLLKKTGAVLCCTARDLVDDAGNPLNHTIHVKPKITYKYLLSHNSITCSSVLIRTDAMREFPMMHEDSHEDYISWLKILKKYGAACGIDIPYVRYRMSMHSKSGNKLKSARMTYKVYDYMGFNKIQSGILFISYAVHGVIKYTFKR